MAIIDSSCEKAIIFAKEINPNINIDNGINWIWASPFLSNEDAKKFDDYCNNNNLESLVGSPITNERFECFGNHLKSLDGYKGELDLLFCHNKFNNFLNR